MSQISCKLSFVYILKNLGGCLFFRTCLLYRTFPVSTCIELLLLFCVARCFGVRVSSIGTSSVEAQIWLAVVHVIELRGVTFMQIRLPQDAYHAVQE
jgi:hypothetical protein